MVERQLLAIDEGKRDRARAHAGASSAIARDRLGLGAYEHIGDFLTNELVDHVPVGSVRLRDPATIQLAEA